MCKFIVCLVLFTSAVFSAPADDEAATEVTQVDHSVGEPGVGRHLLIKAFPGVANYQSDLYEVYAVPYDYGVREGREDIYATRAIAVLKGEGDVSGEIEFIQREAGLIGGGAVLIRGNITGLPAGKHGLHIHQSGDLREGCDKLGGHFNPYMLHHGGPGGPRHAGDLGNVEAGEDGTAEVKFLDPGLTISGGPRGVVGRALVISADPDDLGRGGNAESFQNGNSGNAIACGVIAYIR